MERETRLLYSFVLDHQLRGHAVRVHVVRVHMDPLAYQYSARCSIVRVREIYLVDFLMFFNMGTNIVWVSRIASSNSRLYMDYVLGVPAITIVLWNETQKFSFCVFPIITRGPCGMIAYRSLCTTVVISM